MSWFSPRTTTTTMDPSPSRTENIPSPTKHMAPIYSVIHGTMDATGRIGRLGKTQQLSMGEYFRIHLSSGPGIIFKCNVSDFQLTVRSLSSHSFHRLESSHTLCGSNDTRRLWLFWKTSSSPSIPDSWPFQQLGFRFRNQQPHDSK